MKYLFARSAEIFFFEMQERRDTHAALDFGRRIEQRWAYSAAPPGTSVLDEKGKGFLLSLHLKCLHRIFFPEFCPSKLLNPSLFLSPAPRTFRRPGPRWVETLVFLHFFLKFLLSKHLSKFNIQTTSKKLENKGFWPPKTVPKPFKNPSQINVPEQA